MFLVIAAAGHETTVHTHPLDVVSVSRREYSITAAATQQCQTLQLVHSLRRSFNSAQPYVVCLLVYNTVMFVYWSTTLLCLFTGLEHCYVCLLV